MGDTMSCVMDESSSSSEGEHQPHSTSDTSFIGSISACVTDFDDMDDDNDDLSFLQNPEQVETLLEDSSKEDMLDNKLSKLGRRQCAFFRVPLTLDKPLGVRRFPHLKAKRTGDAIVPGEVVETCQEILLNGMKFYKLFSYNRGWLFEFLPQQNLVMLEPQPGEITAEFQRYKYRGDNTKPCIITFGPSVHSPPTAHIIEPQEEVESILRWLPSDGTGQIYIKLADYRGWVALVDAKSGEVLFDEVDM